MLISSQFVGLHTTSNASRIHIQSCGGKGASAPSPHPQVITRSTSTSLRPWLCRIARGLNLLVLLKGVLNFLILFLDSTLTSNTLFTYSRTSPSRGGGGGRLSFACSYAPPVNGGGHPAPTVTATKVNF